MKNNTLLFLSFFFFLVLVLPSCNSGSDDAFNPADISTVKPLTENHKAFIARFYPDAIEANKKIMVDRSLLLNLRDDYSHVIHKKNKLKYVNDLAARYRYGDDFFNDQLSKESYVKRIDTLLFRVDYIPEKLVMAQAIIESGWGKSKFANEVNNYFGIHCHTPGCGPSASGVENPKFWVKSFPTLEDCIEEYIWLLNTGFAYQELREKRLELRQVNKYPNAKELAQGLKRYSEKGSEYIDLIDSIIDNYLPQNLAEFVRFVNSGQEMAENSDKDK